MNNSKTFVIDTNVLISYALTYESRAGQATRRAFSSGQVVYSSASAKNGNNYSDNSLS